MKYLFTVLLLSVFSLQVEAGCWLKGKEYPTGIVIDGYKCGYDGMWKKT